MQESSLSICGKFAERGRDDSAKLKLNKPYRENPEIILTEVPIYVLTRFPHKQTICQEPKDWSLYCFSHLLQN
jgi:hypothetical protein